MAIKVDNLNNLFWDNGGFRFPNTYPHLVNGQWLEKITPVMTSPFTGWVILTGEFNYCEYKGELFFLKKDALISGNKEKWRYILIKDHICTLFKNKANVIASGTLINASLDKLKDSDFQFTFPVFNNFNKRILLPLASESFNWKKHVIPAPPTRIFKERFAIDDKDYSIFIRQLENNKNLFGVKKFEKSNTFTLLGRAKLTRKLNNWKNELIQKIKELLNSLDDNNLVLGQITGAIGSQFLRNKWCLTWKNSHSLTTNIEQHKQVLNLDLSNLEDIELVSTVTGKKDNNTFFKIPLKKVQVDETRDLITPTYIKKLSRRIRVPFLNKYSTRAIYERHGKLSTWYTPYLDGLNLCLPQKIFIKKRPSLLAKTKYQTNFPTNRKIESFRSVYLYYCFNLNFLFQFNTKAGVYAKAYKEGEFVKARQYFSDSSDPRISLSENLLEGNPKSIDVVTPQYEDYYPWKNKINEPLNIGWLVGQFSLWINDQDNLFDINAPFLVKKTIDSLKRIKGLNNIVSKLIQNEDIYEETTVGEESNFHYTLDVFNTLPARARQATSEADFLIGEKLLFTSWGLAAYSLFQPITGDGYDYTKSRLDRNNKLLGKWLTEANWFYAYYLFGDDTYPLTELAKGWFKKAYSNFDKLEYKNFYSSPSNYAVLKKHIKQNTQEYFLTETVNFSDTPIKGLKEGDIFFSDLDWFFYDHSEGTDLTEKNNDWYTHIKSSEADLSDGEIVVYHNIQKGGLSIGRANVWETETILPDGQFIAQGNQIDNYSSSNNKVVSKLTKISELSHYEDFDGVINRLINLDGRTNNLFSDVVDFNLKQLADSGNYLFDLKGTDFYCYLDIENRIHLIFKEGDRDIKVNKKQVYSIAGNEAIEKLDKEQWVNQKIILSIYGRKIDLPIKAFQKKILTTIYLDTATIENETQELIDSHKVEVSHALGKLYLRFDTPKIQSKGVTAFNAYEMEKMDIANMRAYEDYLIKRKEFELSMENMELEHNKIKFDLKMEQVNNITNQIMGTIGGTVALVGAIGAGVSGFVSGGLGFAVASGLITASTKAFKGVINNMRMQSTYEQKIEHINQKLENSIKQQAINSYTIDLTYARQKEDFALNLRQLFSNQSFNQSSSRERAQALDDKEEDLSILKRKEDKEIYLELWTISEKQKDYCQKYHEEFGVDCRVSNVLIPLGNGMKTGVYKMESVELLNLNDRVDLLLIKALLENGIQIVEWIEHEKVRELIPEDPRIAKLQKQIEEQENLRQALEHEKEVLNSRIEQLTHELGEIKDEEARLKDDIKEKEQDINTKKERIQEIEKQLESEASKYHTLSESYRKLEQEKKVEERLKNLYLDEKNKLANELKDVKQSHSDLSYEKDALKIELRTKRKEISRLNSSNKELANQIKQLKQQLEEEKEKSSELESKKKENESQKLQIDQQLLKIQELEKELQNKSETATGDILIDTYKAVDYLITKKDDKVVITAWNKEKNIWQEQPDLIVKRRNETKLLRIAYKDEKFVTNQYPFWSWYTNEHRDKFNIKVSTFNILEGYVNDTKLKQAHSWVGRYSVEVDKNIPYLDVNGNWVKPYWYHKVKGWFDYEYEGATKIESYEQYKGLFNNVVIALRNELEEKDNTIKALRELESAPKESKELTDNDLKILVKHIFTYDFFSSFTSLWQYSALIITNDSQNGLIYLEFKRNVFCWVTRKLKIWAYDGYKAFSISKRPDNVLDLMDNSRDYWRTLNSGYFARNITHWQGTAGASALVDWVYVGNHNVNIIKDLKWPYFEVEPKSDEDLVRNAKGKIYYDKEAREYTYITTDIPVNNYRDYKRTLRMMFSPN